MDLTLKENYKNKYPIVFDSLLLITGQTFCINTQQPHTQPTEHQLNTFKKKDKQQQQQINISARSLLFRNS